MDNIVFLNPRDFKRLQSMGCGYYDEASEKERELTGVVGYIGRKAIKVSVNAPRRPKFWLYSFLNKYLSR